MRTTRVSTNQKEHKKAALLSWLFALTAALCALIIVFTLIINAVKAGSTGMVQTIEPGDVVLMCRLSAHLKTPDRGDIYVYETASGDVAIARIIALSDETVTLDGGSVYINGVYLDESIYTADPVSDMESTRLEKGQFFLLPDVREGISTPQIFILSAEKLMGKVFMRTSPTIKLY